MKIEFKIDKRYKGKKGYPLILSVYLSIKDRTTTSLGYFADESNWNFILNEPKKNHQYYLAISDCVSNSPNSSVTKVKLPMVSYQYLGRFRYKSLFYLIKFNGFFLGVHF
ncbi:MAG: hypothetical protein ACK5IC_04055 [Moheibacter sp.]